MVPIEGYLFSVLPRPPTLYPTPRWLSSQCLGRLGDRSPARRLLCWMLLGIDDVVVRWRRDERVMDRGHCSIRACGKSFTGWALRLARSRCWSYRRRCVVGDAIAHVRFGSLADIPNAHLHVCFREESGLRDES